MSSHLPANLQDILVNSGFVSEADYLSAKEAADELERPIEDILIFRGIISEQALGQLIAEAQGVPFITLKTKSIPLEVLETVPENQARSYQIIPFEKTDTEISIAFTDPQNFESQEIARRATKLKIIPYYILPNDLTQALTQYKKGIKKVFADILSENIKKSTARTQTDITKVASDLPVVKILDTILEYAIAERASDIHVETLNNALMIRFRIDGNLRDIIALPKQIQPAIVARIKILGQLKIDEHRVPQDGRFKFSYADQSIALRVSIIPSFYGENIVMRMLFESARPLSLSELGMSGGALEIIRHNITRPHGMLLVTGPTGSGKTTTLYSILNMLNTTAVNICTVEDPIEYGIHRVNQIQVNPATGLTFAAGLRALLRHDPNIIMVGEIRDTETAEMGIHASLTGHLVLSTLHTNSAVGAIPRLIDMGVESFLLASTLNVVMAQRLVRRLCPSCIYRIADDPTATEVFGKYRPQIKKVTTFRSHGCHECGNTGFRGRISVYEVLEIDGDIRKLIVDNASADNILELAQKQGMTTMIEDGLDKVTAGLTTVEEVLRAVKEQD